MYLKTSNGYTLSEAYGKNLLADISDNNKMKKKPQVHSHL